MKELSEEKTFAACLRSRGMKFTPERRAIVREIAALGRHFGIDELHQRLRRKHSISLATLYRTIPLLLECGILARATRYRGMVTYEPIYGRAHHHHMVCVECGRIIEFSDEEMEKLQEAICARYDFIPLEHRLGIRGYCSRCAPGKKKRKDVTD